MKQIILSLFIASISLFASNQQMPPIPVEAYTVNNKDTKISKEYPAVIKASRSVNIIARVSGNLEKRYFKEGDYVKKGAKLYKIEQDIYLAKLNEAKAKLAQAKAALTKASKDWERYKKLYKSNSISASTKDQYQYNYDNAKANVENFKAMLKNAQIQYAYTTIKAPISGIVSTTQLNVGNIVSPNNVLTTITKTDPVYVEFSLPQKDINKYLKLIKDGKVTFSIKSNGKIFKDGKLSYISPTLDSSSDSLLLKVTFENSNSDIIIGQFTTLTLGNITLENSYIIPEQAILQNGNMSLVYVVQNGMAIPRPVQIYAQTQDGIVINGGLKNQEQIVISNMAKVRPKSKVQIIKGKE